MHLFTKPGLICKTLGAWARLAVRVYGTSFLFRSCNPHAASWRQSVTGNKAYWRRLAEESKCNTNLQLMRRTDALLLASKVNIAGAVTATSNSACTCDAARAGPREVREKPCPRPPTAIAHYLDCLRRPSILRQQMTPEPLPTDTYRFRPRGPHILDRR